MTAERGEQYRSPEGLTQNQEKLALLLFDSNLTGPISIDRRRTLQDGSFEFYSVVRDSCPVDFAQEDEFVFKHHSKRPDAPLSPIKYNLRSLDSETLGQIGVVLDELCSFEESPDLMTGIPNAGVDIAKAYSKASGIPYADLLEKEDEGTQRRIVTKEAIDLRSGSVVIVDDLVTEGNSKLEAIEAVRKMGLDVQALVVVIDRQQGGIENLREMGIDVRAAMNQTQLLDFGLRTKRITQDQYDSAKAYLGQ